MSTQDEFMRASDAFSWYQESDPTMRATIVAVAWLDRAPDWARLAERVESASRLVPRLRQRVTELPAHLAVPRWVTDDSFELRGTCAARPRCQTKRCWNSVGSRR